MWQLPYLRHTQRSSLRRMGLFACLMTVLLLGFVIGRGSRAEELPDQIYLNNAGPAKPTPTAEARAGRASDRRAPLTRVARRSATPVTPRKRSTPRATPAPRKSAVSLDDGPSRYVIGEENDGVIVTLSAMESEVVRLTNIERRHAKCKPLRIDNRLTQSARVHSAEMADSGRFSHSSPKGGTPWDRMEAAGYRDGGAENIGRGYVSAEETVQSWMATTSHRRNILNCKLTATGVGAVEGTDGPWWTQDFGYS